MNYYPSINIETRVHISPTPSQGQSGITAGISSPNFAAVSEANAKLKALQVKALEQERAQHVRRFVLTLIFTFIFSAYLYSAQANAGVYKCEENGTVTYSQFPCADGSSENLTRKYQRAGNQMSSALPAVNRVSNPSHNGFESERVTMPAKDAINLRNTSCSQNNGTTIYTATLVNISQYSQYRAKLKLAFTYAKNGMKRDKPWDSKQDTFVLKPNETRSISFKSRLAPRSFEMSCDSHLDVTFLGSKD